MDKVDKSPGRSVGSIVVLAEELSREGFTKTDLSNFRSSKASAPFIKDLKEKAELKRGEEGSKSAKSPAAKSVRLTPEKPLDPKYGKMKKEEWEMVAKAYRTAAEEIFKKTGHKPVSADDIHGIDLARAMGYTAFEGRAKRIIIEFDGTRGTDEIIDEIVGAVSIGRGISRGRGLIRDNFSHLTSEEIEKPAIYFPLGRYYLNKKRLMEDVLYLRGAKGNAIAGFPSQKISPELKDCLLAMLKHRQPTLKGLSREDRVLLGKINTKCQLMDPAWESRGSGNGKYVRQC